VKTLDIEQRSDLWLTWRKEGIGASESSALLRMSKYDSPMDIWEQKTARAFPKIVNFDMQRGINLEEEARHKFQSLMGRMFFPICGERDDLPFVKASFDGIDCNHEYFVEIKCPRSDKLGDALDSGIIYRIKEEFPHYWCQVQHQYAVCDTAKVGYLAAYLGGEINYLHIPRDDTFINNTLIPEITRFWNDHVLADKEPELTDADYLYIDDAEAISIANEWKGINEELKALQEKEKGLRKRLIEHGDDGNVIIGNVVKLTRYATTRINFKMACIDNEIDMEKYKKTTIGCYRFTPIK